MLSTTALRGIVAAVNGILILVVVYTAWLTFFYVDEEYWDVKAPKDEHYTPPLRRDDELQASRDAYDRIFRMFKSADEAPEPVEPVVDTTPTPPPPPATPPIDKVKVTAVFYNETNPGRSTAWLQMGAAERTFIAGMKLGDYPEADWKDVGGFILKEIAKDEVVLVGPDGKERRLKGAGGQP